VARKIGMQRAGHAARNARPARVARDARGGTRGRLTPLHRAAAWGREAAVALLLAHDADVHAKDKSGCGGPAGARPSRTTRAWAHGCDGVRTLRRSAV
jgi:hypothetical protein